MDYITIPTELFVWAFRNKKYKQLQLYLDLKFSRGDGKCDFSYLETLADKYECSEKTISRRFKWLEDNNWIGIHKNKRDWFYVRGLKSICCYCDIWYSSGIKMNEVPTFERMANILINVIGKQIIHVQTRKVLKREIPNTLKEFRDDGVPMGVNYIRKFLNCSQTYADRIKRLAQNDVWYKSIEVTPNFKEIPFLRAEEITPLNKYISDKFFVTQNDLGLKRVFLRKPDLIKIKLKFCVWHNHNRNFEPKYKIK